MSQPVRPMRSCAGRDAGHYGVAFSARPVLGECCCRYGIGHTSAYAEVAAGRPRAIKAGKRTLITADAAEAWLASLPVGQLGHLPSEQRRELVAGEPTGERARAEAGG